MNQLIWIALLLTYIISSSADYVTVERRDLQGGMNCTQDKECGGKPYGLCVNFTCECSFDRYEADCSYQAKDATTGAALFALAAVGLFGIGRLYLLYPLGAGQLILGVAGFILIIPICGAACCAKSGRSMMIVAIISKVLIGLCFITTFAWSLADCILIATNQVTVDGLGYPLIPAK